MRGRSRFSEKGIRRCEECGLPLYRKKYGTRMESISAFVKRRFCSSKCANTRELVTKQAYSLRGRALMGEFCEACGERDPELLDVHHIDQNHENNNKANLQTLCTTCHDFWHSTANHHNRYPAGKMPKLYQSFEVFEKRKEDFEK